tara:strand:+ start:2564 stop:3052 length:489 start_codon:yes stop_codon:yes gene_type:complete
MNKFLIIFIFFITNSIVAEEIIKGKAQVINSDYIKINDQIIILYGIEAMERKQICYIDGKEWPCYDITVRFLESLVDLGETSCNIVKVKRTRMGRLFGRCYVNGVDISEELVKQGWAFARVKQTKDYLSYEKEAKKKKIGIWMSKFIKPWVWRKKYNIPSDP